MLLERLFNDSLQGALMRIAVELNRMVYENEVCVELKYNGDSKNTIVNVEHIETRIVVQYKDGAYLSLFRTYADITLMPDYGPPPLKIEGGSYEV